MSATGAGERLCETAIQELGMTKSYQSFPVDKENLPVVSSDTTVVDEPPDGGYGWVCVACVFLLNAHTWGINSVETSPDIQSSLQLLIHRPC